MLLREVIEMCEKNIENVKRKRMVVKMINKVLQEEVNEFLGEACEDK